ncbi:Uncharacterised protein [Staphylococcus aureus]|nr:Uncharacterised protein [Staphylococcus aureus]
MTFKSFCLAVLCTALPMLLNLVPGFTFAIAFSNAIVATSHTFCFIGSSDSPTTNEMPVSA